MESENIEYRQNLAKEEEDSDNNFNEVTSEDALSLLRLLNARGYFC